MNRQGKNILIGTFVIAAVVVVVFLVLFLHPRIGDQSRRLKVRFANIEKIQIGTRVTFAGKPVGRVVEIRQIRDARSGPADQEGDIYFWEVTLALDSGVKVFDTDEISIYTPGFFGERNIAIFPKEPEPGRVSRPLQPKEVVYAESTDQVQDIFNELGGIASKAKASCEQLTEFVEENREAIHTAIVAFGDAMTAISGTFSDANQQELVAAVKKLVENATTTLQEIGLFAHALEDEALAENISEAAASINTLARKISCGHGSLGRLINDDALYRRVMGVMAKADTMFADINHYGLLFHLKRQWQRERTRHLENLRSLCTTADYQNYFISQVGMIQTSLDRLSMLLDKARVECPNSPLLGNQEHLCDLAQLREEVEELSLRLQKSCPACYGER